MIAPYLVAAMAVALTTGQAFAQTSTTPPGVVGSSVTTPRGSAVVTGAMGSVTTTTMPGAGGSGLLEGNGNGTSTLLTPGGNPMVVATPR